MSKSRHEGRASQYRIISIKSPGYRQEFINGALSNVPPRGEIVCDFHFESKVKSENEKVVYFISKHIINIIK